MRFAFVSSFVLACALSAQQASIVIPPQYANTEAPGGTAYGWGLGTAQSHVQWIYDSSYFTSQGIDHPILITRLRWRANGASTVASGVYSQATLKLASAAVDARSPTTTFANNVGPDLTTVYSGPVTVAAGQGRSPNNWFVDLQLQTPFLYDPTLGADIVTEFAVPPSTLTGSTANHDAVFDASTTPPQTILGGRCQSTTSYTATTGATLVGGLLVLEFGFDYPAGVAYGAKYGNGCYDTAISWYEQFAAAGFDLANSSVRMTNAGTNYVVTPGVSGWYAPVATALTMADDTITTPQALPFTFPWIGGSTSSIQICSNGCVLLQSTTATTGQATPTVASLLSGLARLSPAWADWNPAAGGTVHMDVTPSNTVVITWNGVFEFGQTNPCSFQLEMDSAGNVEYRYLNVATVTHALQTSFSPGTNARDPGSRDLSAAMPFFTQPDGLGMMLTNTGRPRIGNTFQMTSSSYPATASIGFTFFGFASVPTGLPLAALGMAGCSQYTTPDASLLWIATGPTAAVPFAIPANPSFAGIVLNSQSLTLVPGINPFGAITSNGVALHIEAR